ncbi:hypothetical protein AB0A94_23925 [Streptomyces sp. NPDC044984]|uniref:hypothetical protein n=1 Tax=Streptomyces sp. NPDC044984 TaxID=3154335 RepID=UPI0033D9A669
MHDRTPIVPVPGRRGSRIRRRALAAGLLAAPVCAPLPLLTEAAGASTEAAATARRTSGSRAVKGDSGGPVHTVDGSGRAFAKGIISGGGGGGDHSGGLFGPCRLYFTDIGPANSTFPGTVARY